MKQKVFSASYFILLRNLSVSTSRNRTMNRTRTKYKYSFVLIKQSVVCWVGQHYSSNSWLSEPPSPVDIDHSRKVAQYNLTMMFSFRRLLINSYLGSIADVPSQPLSLHAAAPRAPHRRWRPRCLPDQRRHRRCVQPLDTRQHAVVPRREPQHVRGNHNRSALWYLLTVITLYASQSLSLSSVSVRDEFV